MHVVLNLLRVDCPADSRNQRRYMSATLLRLKSGKKIYMVEEEISTGASKSRCRDIQEGTMVWISVSRLKFFGLIRSVESTVSGWFHHSLFYSSCASPCHFHPFLEWGERFRRRRRRSRKNLITPCMNDTSRVLLVVSTLWTMDWSPIVVHDYVSPQGIRSNSTYCIFCFFSNFVSL